MSSQRVQVSSNDECSEHGDMASGSKKVSMLHVEWKAGKQAKSKAKSTCGVDSKKGSQADQVQYFKQKAHESFMQVMYVCDNGSQVQELHDEEIEQLKEEYQVKIDKLENQLKLKNKYFHPHFSTIEVFKRNSKLHILDLEKNLEIEGLELIDCRDNTLTRFDESAILSFKEFLSEKEGDAKIHSMRENLFNFIASQLQKHLPNSDTLVKNIQFEINRVFQYVVEVRQELLLKVESHQTLLKKYEEIDSNHKKLKTRFQSIHKDAILMSENLNKLKQEKITHLQKINDMQARTMELQRQNRVQQNTKENLLKGSIKDTKIGLVSYKNLLTSYKSIAANNSGRSNVFKSQKNFQAANIQEDNSGPEQQTNNDTSRNQDESFNMKDLIAEINEHPLGGTQYSKMEKKTQKYVPAPLTNRQRKKSFHN